MSSGRRARRAGRPAMPKEAHFITHRTGLIALARAAPAATLLLAAAPSHSGPIGHWVDAAAISPAAYELPTLPPRLAALADRFRPGAPVTGTVRVRMYLSTGGAQLRVRFTNEAGTQPFTIEAASVALAAADSDDARGPVKRLTFGGRPSITLAPGAPALSDPVDIATTAMSEVVISAYVPGGVAFNPAGGMGMTAAAGNQIDIEHMPAAIRLVGRPLVSGLQVATARPVSTIVTLGDSITDGARTQRGDLRGWPEALARRFAPGPAHAVLNAGIAGGYVLTSWWGDGALARLDRDALRVPGLSNLVVLEGINDISTSGGSEVLGPRPEITAEDLIAGYRQIIARAHLLNVKVIGATLTPFKGAPPYSPAKEVIRLAVNRWIRTSGEYDAVIDFEAVLRDPAHPENLRAEFDSGDHLHPNAKGYQAMADAIDLRVFK